MVIMCAPRAPCGGPTYEPGEAADARVDEDARELLVGRELLLGREDEEELPLVDRSPVLPVPEGRRLLEVGVDAVRESEVERRVADAARSDAVGGGGGRVEDERTRGEVERVSLPARDEAEVEVGGGEDGEVMDGGAGWFNVAVTLHKG